MIANIDISHLMVRVEADDDCPWSGVQHPVPTSVSTFLPPHIFACLLHPKPDARVKRSILVLDDGLDPVRGVEILVSSEDLDLDPAEFYKRVLRAPLEQMWYARFPEQQAALVARASAIINQLAARGELTHGAPT